MDFKNESDVRKDLEKELRLNESEYDDVETFNWSDETIIMIALLKILRQGGRIHYG